MSVKVVTEIYCDVCAAKAEQASLDSRGSVRLPRNWRWFHDDEDYDGPQWSSVSVVCGDRCWIVATDAEKETLDRISKVAPTYFKESVRKFLSLSQPTTPVEFPGA